MTKLTLPWTRQGRFLRALAECGCIARACRAADLDRRLAYRWRDRDRRFCPPLESGCRSWGRSNTR